MNRLNAIIATRVWRPRLFVADIVVIYISILDTVFVAYDFEI